MSTEKFKNSEATELGHADQDSADRRARRRREPGKLGDEISSVLSSMDPEVQTEMKKLVSSGNPKEIEDKMLDYVVKDDRASLVRWFSRKNSKSDRKTINRGTYFISLIPVVIALYCIFSILFTGHIKAPW